MKGLRINERLLGNRPAMAGLIVVAVAALYGAASFARPVVAIEHDGPRRVPILSTVVACPDPSSSSKIKTRVAAFTPAAGNTAGRPVAGGAHNGQAQITAVDPDAKAAPLATLANPSITWSSDTKDDEDPYAVRANGVMAGGLEVEQTSAASSGGSRGLAGLRCVPPGIDTWFVGPGPVDAEKIELHLVNVDDQPAVVDLEAFSQDGPIDTTDAGGVSIKPHDSQVVTIGESDEGLAGVVEEAETLALRVQSRQGRVAASLRIRMKDGRGIDWIPAAEAPSVHLTVPGVPPGKGARQLLLAVPGDTDARVTMQVITEKGVFTPEGRDIVDAPAQTVTRLDLDRVLNGKAAAVRINSDEPLVASLVARMDVGGTPDFGAIAAAPGLVERGALADLRGGEGQEAKLLLTSPESDASVRIVTVTANGPVGSLQDVQLKTGRTTVVTLRPPQGAEKGYAAVVTPQGGSGLIYAARLQTAKKQGFTLMPVTSARTWLTGPQVADSVTALIPSRDGR